MVWRDSAAILTSACSSEEEEHGLFWSALAKLFIGGWEWPLRWSGRLTELGIVLQSKKVNSDGMCRWYQIYQNTWGDVALTLTANDYQVVCHGVAAELSFGDIFVLVAFSGCLLKADLGLKVLSVAVTPLTQVPVGHWAVWAGSPPVTVDTGEGSVAWTSKKGRGHLVWEVVNPAAAELRKGIPGGWFSQWVSLFALAGCRTELQPWRVGEPCTDPNCRQ